MEPELLESLSEGVVTLALNRPERLNALSSPIMEGLLEALPRLAQDPAVGSSCSPAPVARSVQAATSKAWPWVRPSAPYRRR